MMAARRVPGDENRPMKVVATFHRLKEDRDGDVLHGALVALAIVAIVCLAIDFSVRGGVCLALENWAKPHTEAAR